MVANEGAVLGDPRAGRLVRPFAIGPTAARRRADRLADAEVRQGLAGHMGEVDDQGLPRPHGLTASPVDQHSSLWGVPTELAGRSGRYAVFGEAAGGVSMRWRNSDGVTPITPRKPRLKVLTDR